MRGLKRNNRKEEEEHPKTQIEMMSNTLEAITGYAQAQNMTENQAALVLILNELRCIHWHYDLELAKQEEWKIPKLEE